ncbi:hypothetical protein BDW67DRAFT_85224 [Aspergillus spinulosporus]
MQHRDVQSTALVLEPNGAGPLHRVLSTNITDGSHREIGYCNVFPLRLTYDQHGWGRHSVQEYTSIPLPLPYQAWILRPPGYGAHDIRRRELDGMEDTLRRLCHGLNQHDCDTVAILDLVHNFSIT